MLRRDFLRSLAVAGLLPNTLLSQQTATPAPPPPAPVPWTLGLNPKTPLPETETADGVADGVTRFFTATQLAALTRLCELLLPALGDKPGAVEAGAPAFLDFLIGQSGEPRQKVYQGGLDWLHAEAKQKYERSFAELDAARADAVIKPWLRTWMSDHPPTEVHADFVNIAHEDIRTATRNSKAWNDASAAAGQDWVTGGLYWSPIEPDMAGLGATATHLPQHGMAAPKAAHAMPSYPR
ncbi:gluconate 2-dehydrogenase subunit 3 family protein [Silvibacterium sp.]|uniref:gluconate 2-dehydrogenase subunit 3 family protein n=1 Tax=Silvibacterium sp. TaxID=1964179 RepID=UPI0039E4AE59